MSTANTPEESKKLTAWMEVNNADGSKSTLNMGRELAKNGSTVFSDGKTSLFVHREHKGIYLKQGEDASVRLWLKEGETQPKAEGDKAKPYFFLSGSPDGSKENEVKVNLHGSKELTEAIKADIRAQDQLGRDDDVARKAQREAAQGAAPAAPEAKDPAPAGVVRRSRKP